MPTKLIKTEALSGKDIKHPAQSLPPQHEMHPKDVNSLPLNAYSSMYQRHSLNVTQPQHIREEDLRR